MKDILLTLLLTIQCGSSTVAQNFALQDSARRHEYNFSQLGNETVAFIKQPTNWRTEDYLKLGLMAAGTFLVMQADQPIRTAVQKDQRYYYSVPIVGGRAWGELYSPITLFSLYAVLSSITGDNGTRKIAYEIVQASLYASAIAFLLKETIGRARPFTEEGRASYHPLTLFSDNYHSLPGGHTTVAVGLSTVLSRNAGPTWLKIVAYLPAGLTAISRVYQDEHWASDDFLGAAVGYFVAEWVVNQHEQKENRIELSSVYPFTVRIILH